MEQVYEKYKDNPEVQIFVIYTDEPHPGQMRFTDIEQPKTIEERLHLVRATCQEDQIKRPILIDTMDNTVKRQFGNLPNCGIIIDKSGIIVEKQGWIDPKKVDEVLTDLLSRH